MSQGRHGLVVACCWVIFGAASTMTHAAEPSSATSGNTSSAATEILDWETGANKSYAVPAYEIPAFLTSLNLFDRTFLDRSVYGVTARSAWRNAKTLSLEYDDDPFQVNQFGHPTEGAITFGTARSAGLGFWTSLVYSDAGSFLWEVAGETGKASFNDLITTGQAGSLFGEAMFRIASLILERGGPHPALWREVSAGVLMPPLALNRWVHGERFKPIFPSHNPALLWQAQFGASADDRVRDNNAISTVKRQEAVLNYLFAYGLPGRDAYRYERPFDYFQLEVGAMTSAHTHNWLDHLFIRGLLWGKEYDSGDNYTGIFGVYGSYDYASPQVFRVSSTAASLGTTFQWWTAPGIVAQGSLLTGVGFAGAGTNPVKGLRDYHYGVTPQGLAALRLIFHDRVMLDLVGRGYYISGTGSDDLLGTETIATGKAGITWRLDGRHALGLQYVASHRYSIYNGLRPTTHQSVGTFSLTYSFLSDERFGAIGSHR
jgi:hypothetical protein